MPTMTDNRSRVSFGPHALCENCWDLVTGYRTPHRMVAEHREREDCCRCGLGTFSGIYLRIDNRELYSCPGHD